MAKKMSISFVRASTKPFLGFQITMPAIIAFVAYLVLAFVIIMPFDFPAVDDNGNEYIVKYDLAQRLLILVLMAIPIALSIYTINCMMVGSCTLWSYVTAILSVFWIAMFVITAFIYTIKKQ